MSFSFLLRRDGIGESDYRISGGKIVISTDNDAVRDRLFTSLSTQLGEWYLDNTDGIPYSGENGILGGKKSEGEVAAIIRRRILSDPDVSRIDSLSVSQDSFRRVSVAVEVRLQSGDQLSVEV
jgi:hypothetical protein